MRKHFVPYELSAKLERLGFDEDVFKYYCSTPIYNGEHALDNSFDDWYGSIKAPLWQQAFDWFTDKGLHSYIEGAYPWFRYYINTEDNRYEGFKHLDIYEARLACLEQLIKIIENERDKQI